MYRRALISLAFIGFVSQAQAHDAPSGWKYDFKCCSGVDCRDIHQNVKLTNGGYVVPSGELIPYQSTKVKPSQDDEYHWCTQSGKDNTPTICLYVPARGF